MRYAMIMAGGAGTRLWPMSRNQRPKQLLPLIPSADGRVQSLLEIAAARMEGLVPPDRRYICTAESFRHQIREALPQFADHQILGEPCGRDTVNAVGLGAAVLSKLDKNAIFCILTADHLISPEETFKQRVDLAFRMAEQDKRRLVTFSIRPTYPATGFGYVERGPALHGITDEKGGGSGGGVGGVGGVGGEVRTSPTASHALSKSPMPRALRLISSQATSPGTAACSCCTRASSLNASKSTSPRAMKD